MASMVLNILHIAVEIMAQMVIKVRHVFSSEMTMTTETILVVNSLNVCNEIMAQLKI